MIETSIIKINGKTMYLELGHNVAEWKKKFDVPEERDCNASTYWDFSFEDFLNGAVEINEDITYWYINGRVYETDYLPF